jgi:hypothetical protein
MNGYGYVVTEQFCKRIDELKSRELVISTISVAKEQVECSRAVSTSKRADILLGEKSGEQYQLKAEMHYRKRISQLRNTKQQLAQLVENVDENQTKYCSELLKRDGLKAYTAYN